MTQTLPNAAVDRNGYMPLYIQVKNSLHELISSGVWQAGYQMPAESELCRTFQVSRTVVRQALKEMEYEGLIEREQGKGTFVARPKIDQSLAQRLTGFYQDMVTRGLTPVTRILRQRVASASALVAARLQIAPGSSVVEIHRLRGLQNEPFILDYTYLPYALCPTLVGEDLAHQSLYAVLEQKLGLEIARGHRTLEAVRATEYEAQLLNIEQGDPLILLDSVVYLADGTPIEYFHALHRGGRSRFEVELVRIRE